MIALESIPAIPADLVRWGGRRLEAKGLLHPLRESQLLLSSILGLSPGMLFVETFRPVAKSKIEKFVRSLDKRSSGIPLAYIVGETGFYNHLFKTDRRALIPRPDTEIIVEEALKLFPDAGSRARLLELGCGCGNICLSLALERPEWEILASDLSGDALSLARENALLLGLDGRVEFRPGDLFSPWEAAGPFDLIVSNPPYVPTWDWERLAAEVRDFEPRIALDGGKDGLAVISRILEKAGEMLFPGGWALIEIDSKQALPVAELGLRAGLSFAGIVKDWAGRDRVVGFRRGRHPYPDPVGIPLRRDPFGKGADHEGML